MCVVEFNLFWCLMQGLGADQCNPEGFKKEGLDAAAVVTRHDSLHVRFYTFWLFIHDISLFSSLSQLIGSTLALGYMRAGAFPCIFTL
jgi:hypothetical protein